MPSHDQQREARQLALGAVFEADFGQRTATRALERRLADEATRPSRQPAWRARSSPRWPTNATSSTLGSKSCAPRYPVVQLARIDRALLRCALAELLHSRTTPARVAIAEWVELARTYSGEPARRLVNGVLGRVARDRHTGGSTE